MYPKNAASPEPIAIGAVVQISDGAVQTSGCTVRIKPIGVSEGDGGGTTAYSTDGIVLYTPTQAETNYTSFVLIAKKTGCIPVSVTVVTTNSSTPGTVDAVKLAGNTAGPTNLNTIFNTDYATVYDTTNKGFNLANSAIRRAAFAADSGMQTTRSNTAQAGASGSITLDASASSVNNYYLGQMVYITGGTGAGQSRPITDYNGTTKVASVTYNWVTNPDNTSTFAILPPNFFDLRSAINYLDTIDSRTADTVTQIGTAGAGLTALGDTRLANLDATVSSRASAASLASLVTTVGVAGAGLTAADDAVIAAIAALNNLSAAQVWAAGTRTLTGLGFTLAASDLASDILTAAKIASDVWTEARTAINGGDYALDTDANGRVRIVDGTGTGEIDTTSGGVAVTAASVRTAVGLASANLDTQLDALPTAAENAAGLLDLSNGIESGVTPRQLLRGVGAALFGLVTGAGTGSEVFKGAGQSSGGTTRLTYTVDSSGNRSGVTLNL